MRQTHRCDTNRLRLLLEDSLPSSKQAEVVDHLDRCGQCQQTLERLAADKSLWDDLHKLATLDLTQQGTPVPVLEASARGTEGRAGDEPQNGPFALDFLDPADDAELLGRLGRFAITAVLGRGGMGVVLKGFDAALNRPVAIKVLAPYFASSGAARQRFDREAKAAATVIHPHVVSIHEVSSWKGLPYLVMSYVGGRSLQDRLDAEGALEIREILRIAMQTAAGLAAAHAQGLVHRDVKPANILLENGIGRVWLTDFGLARAVDDASLTQSGVIAGTPQYMAPEQAGGEGVDHRADLFSLGSTLYAMCTGHPPFRAESAMAVLRRVCDGQPRPIRSINPDIPPWLAGIIDRLHAKKPADRFHSAAEVADLLGSWLAHLQQPDVIPPPAVSAPTKRRKKRLFFTAATTLLVAGGIGLTGLGRNTPEAENSRADQEPARAVRRNNNQQSISARKEDISLERQVESLKQRAAALEHDLKQQPADGLHDPAATLLMETRGRLEELERELAQQQR